MQSFLDGRVVLHHGDNRAVLKGMADNSVDSFVTDPPYALVSIVKRFGAAGSAPCKVAEGGTGAYARASKGFMGKTWDTGDTVHAVEFWQEVLRVLKPGGHVVAFNGTRTQHRMVCAIEDAGFEIRDMLAWLYGTGFPKSHDVSKGIDKAAGAVREVIGPKVYADGTVGSWRTTSSEVYAQDQWTKDNTDRPKLETSPATDAAAVWEGWGTALKPALEPICLARKPLIGTVAANVLEHGTGAINIDRCRVEYTGDADKASATPQGKCTARPGTLAGKAQYDYEKIARAAGWMPEIEFNGEDDGVRSANGENWAEHWQGACEGAGLLTGRGEFERPKLIGRWPANVITDGSEEVVGMFPDSKGQQGDLNATGKVRPTKTCFGNMAAPLPAKARNDFGSAARFFYSAKANKRDRADSKHPTVKPVSLMRWLCRMVTPPGGTLVDPFSGSGTTGEAAYLEGFRAILIEREEEYVADITRRLESISPEEPANDNVPDLFAAATRVAA